MKTMKKIAAVVLALAVIASFASLFTVSAADPVNLAKGKTVTSNTTTFATASGKLENAVDGKHNNDRTLSQWSGNANVWVEINLGAKETVNCVFVEFDKCQDMTVRDLAIDVKVSEDNYKRVAEIHLDAQPAGGTELKIAFEAVETEAIRVTGNKANSNNATYFSLSEIEVYYAENALDQAQYKGVTPATDPATIIPKYEKLENLALTATASVPEARKFQDPIDYINDGKLNTRAIPFFKGASHTSTIYYELKLKEKADINTVVLVTDNAEVKQHAKSFAVDVQGEDGKWVRVAEYHNFEVKSAGTQIRLYFATKKAQAVRVTAHVKGMNTQKADQQDMFFSLAEIEIYNTSDVSESSYAEIQKNANIVIPEYSTNSGSSNSGSSNKVPSKTGDNSNVVAVMVALVAAGFVCIAAAKAQKA